MIARLDACVCCEPRTYSPIWSIAFMIGLDSLGLRATFSCGSVDVAIVKVGQIAFRHT